MNNFKYFMPTEVYFGKDIIARSSELLRKYSGKALIVTGKGSSKKNGSLQDVKETLESIGTEYIIFDEIEENPSLETIDRAAHIGRKEETSFIIGIGGGSPIDAAKVIGILINNRDYDGRDVLSAGALKSIPIIAVPTTAGTGTEVTPYAIVTDHLARTKKNSGQKVFPDIAFLDARYMEHMPYNVTVSTALDAFSHLAEAYLNTNANYLSDCFVERGLKLFGECILPLTDDNITYDIREKLMLVSTLGGMAIAQTGTSLPHGMGYALTYNKGLSHGIANCILYKKYFEAFKDRTRVMEVLRMIGLSSIEELGELISGLIKVNFKITDKEIEDYTDIIANDKGKLKNHPETIARDELYFIYKESLINYII